MQKLMQDSNTVRPAKTDGMWMTTDCTDSDPLDRGSELKD